MPTLIEFPFLGSTQFLSSEYTNYQTIAMVGQIHNLSMDAIAMTPGFPLLTFREKIEIVRDKISEINEYMGISVGANYPAEFVEETVSDIQSAPSLKEYIENTVYTADRNLTKPMFTTLLPLLNLTIAPGITNIESFRILNTLAVSELTIARSRHVSTETKLITIGSINILRNSAQYWFIAENDSLRPWHNSVNAETPPAGAKKWFWRALRDCIGFTAGAAIGMWIGGPPAAAAGGTLIGAAASSNQ